MAIKASDLRLGNWVELNGNNYRVNLVSNNFIEIEVGNRLRGGNPNEHNPISITPDILIKCGFNNVSNVYYDLGANTETVYMGYRLDSNELRISIYNNGCRESNCYLKVFHLHHLQNITHALTNTEIEYKP